MSETKKIVITAMLIALSVVLPLAFHTVPGAGPVLLPMHIPVLLAGLVCGWKYGLASGLAAPILSNTLTGMPPSFAMASLMSIELGVYGLVAGILAYVVRTKSASLDLYICLVISMLAGRLVAGVAMAVYFAPLVTWPDAYGNVAGFTLAAWVATYFVASLPGIVIQLAFVPSVVMALERERVIPFRYPIKAGESA